MTLVWVGLNEFMAFLTIIVVFPGFLPPEDGVELFATFIILIVMSVVWWFFLAVCPISFAIMYFMGDFSWDDWGSAWPWKYLRNRNSPASGK